MIIRLALFISLIAIFYYYCKDGSSLNQFREPNDINKIEVPVEISPRFYYEPLQETTIQVDSSYFDNLTSQAQREQYPKLLTSSLNNY